MIEGRLIGRRSADAGQWLDRHEAQRRTRGGRPLAQVWPIRRADALGLSCVLMVTSIAAIHLVAGGTLVGQDSATQFYPWYGYLGEQLRSLEIPGWNPFQFAGAPFAADPQSGWTYLPAMLIFGLLPLPVAAPVFLFFHLALAGLGAYALSRFLGMPAIAAVVAATAYQLTGPVYGRSACCPAGLEVAVWTPWVLAGAELAIGGRCARSRLGGWALSGFALSQALAAWLGQGSYYLLLALAAFIAYRTMIAPPGKPSPLARLQNALMHGAAITAVGFGLAAAGVLPRLEYVARSNLADGEYGGANAWAATISGATSDSVFSRLLSPTLYYPGAATLALAVIGLIIARGRYAAPFFALLGIAAGILASPTPTPLHRLLFATLPRFEELHEHWPERVALVAYIAPAVLAGASVAVLLEHRDTVRRFWPAVLAPFALAAVLWSFGAGVPTSALLATGGVVALLMMLPAARLTALRGAIPVLLVAVIAADLIAASRTTASQAPYGGFHRVDLGDYYASTGAADFLRARAADGPFRAFGYDPTLRAIQDGQTVLYRHEFDNPATRALNVNNRSMLLGLHDIQGYNPIQVERYVELMEALNGHPQDYHDANVFPAGLDSPLLNLLNVRYIVIPVKDESGQSDLAWLLERFPVVYEDSDVRVLENTAALPRAWIVDDVRAVAPGEALELLGSGAVDPRTTALVEEPLSGVTSAVAGSGGSVDILDHQPDRIRARATATDAGLVVFSEIYDPGWQAYVDGERTPIRIVDHTFQGIQLPAGTSEIELRYETPALALGLAISGATVVALLGTAGWVWFDRRRPIRQALARYR